VNKGSSEERKEDFKNIRHNAFVRIPRKGVTRKIFRDLSYSKTAEIIRYPWKRSILSYLSGKSEEIRKKGSAVSEFGLDAIRRESA
jgi:hypothetical protein